MASIAQPLGHMPIFFFSDLRRPAYGTLGPFFSSQKLYNMIVKLRVKFKKNGKTKLKYQHKWNVSNNKLKEK